VPDKLEVLPGPGLVARFGEVAVWAGAQASAALQAHLVNEAQRLAHAPAGGDELANSLISVLQRGDPEPQAAFAVLGPGTNGLTLFLHGPVQAWESGRWLFPQPVPGWLATAIGRPWPLIILPYGAPPPPQSQQGNPLDLHSGAVPGSGFILLRPPSGPAQGTQGAATSAFGTAAQPGGPGAGSPSSFTAPQAFAAPPTFGGPPALAAPAGPAAVGPPSPSAPPLAPAAQPPFQPPPGSAPSAAAPAQSPPPPAQSTTSAAATTPSPGTIDLRMVGPQLAFPLPLASNWSGSLPPGRPEVVGLLCQRGHLNHPRANSCARCGSSFPPGNPQLSAPRPPIGVLLADDGSIYSLSSGCVIGNDPSVAPEVQAGTLEALPMRAGPNHTMAPVQAEIQVRGWNAYLVDRGAEGGSCVQGPAGEGWSQLSRNEQRELADGSHVSAGGRVLTYLSAWP